MTLADFIRAVDPVLKAGAVTLETDLMIAVPGDLRAWPVYGVRVLSATPRDEGAEARPILIIITNLSDEDEDE